MFYIVLGASVGLISDTYGYTSSNNSMFGAVVIFCGLSGSIIHAVILDRGKKYKHQLIFIGNSNMTNV